MKCLNCGDELRDGIKICPSCGADQDLLRKAMDAKKKGLAEAVSRKKTTPPEVPPKTEEPPKKEPAVARFFDYMTEDVLLRYANAVSNGAGVKKDTATARLAYSNLAERGNIEAMYKLAEINLSEESPKIKDACYWLKMSAAGGYAPANNRLNLLLDKKLITKDDIEVINIGMVGAGVDAGAEVYEMNKSSTVDLSYSSNVRGWSGSGYIISDDGYLLTNAHVVTDGTSGETVPYLTARVDGYSIRADVVAVGDYSVGNPSGVDLALCKLVSMPKGVKPVTFADPDEARNGDTVYVVGNSLGDGSCITKGIISDKSRRLQGRTLLMTDSAMNGGNSGSPLFNTKGQVVATMCCHRAAENGHGEAVQGMNYGVPGGAALDFLKKCNMGIEICVAVKNLPSGKKTTV